MLKRLSDEQEMDSLDERLADLLRSAAPFEADPFRKRRVLVRLSRVQTRHAAPFWLRPAVVATLLVSGTATAALGHRYVAHGTGLFGFGPSVSDSSASSGSSAASSVRSAARTAGASHAGTVSTSGADAASAAAPVITAPTAADALDPPASTQHSASKGSARARSGSGEDATHVVEAIQALRTERDPSRAQGLLNDYLKTHPNGVLSEDALALSIEAASAQHDPQAVDYARRYLAKFPHGKYRALANRAIAQQR